MSENSPKKIFPPFNFTEGEVLILNKPYNWTSFDVVGKIRNSFKPLKLKVGHAGTLDPWQRVYLFMHWQTDQTN